MRNVQSPRARSFGRALLRLHGHSLDQLLVIVKQNYHVIHRLAALRWIVSKAPLSVTMGAPYLQRRRLVRVHYKI